VQWIRTIFSGRGATVQPRIFLIAGRSSHRPVPYTAIGLLSSGLGIEYKDAGFLGSVGAGVLVFRLTRKGLRLRGAFRGKWHRRWTSSCLDRGRRGWGLGRGAGREDFSVPW